MGENVDATGRKSGGGRAWKPSAGGIRSIEGVRTKPWVHRCHRQYHGHHHRIAGSHKRWIDAGFVTLSFPDETGLTPQNSTVSRILNSSVERAACPFVAAIATSDYPNVRWGCYSLGDRHAVRAGLNLGNAGCVRLTTSHSLADTAAGPETATSIGTGTDTGLNPKSEVQTIT